MNIFITGATGFIGTHLIKRMERTQHNVRCLVSKQSAVEKLVRERVSVIQGDVMDKDSLIKGMEGCDSVIHLANVYSFWEPDKKIYARVNIEGTRNVMEIALQSHIRKAVHISSVVVYGKPAECPFDETSAPGPVQFSEYARTKYLGDAIAWRMYKNDGLPLVTVYPGVVMGSGDTKTTGQYIRALINKKMPALAFENSVLTYVHVRDVAEAIIRALEKPDNIGARYLVGKERLSMREVNRMISEISGVSLPAMRMHDSIATINAHFLTLIANIIKKPPLWGLAIDQAKTTKVGFQCDGSKVERELGVVYTPVRTAIEEMIAEI